MPTLSQVGQVRLKLYAIALAAAVSVSCSAGVGKEEPAFNHQRPASDERLINRDPAKEASVTASLSPQRPRIISRQEWKAKDAAGQMQPHTVRRITIHHTAAPQKKGVAIEKKMQALQNFSQGRSRLASGGYKPAWPDVPYHYYIAVDGQIAEGRDIKYVGDTNTDYDPTGHALVVLEGNFEKEQPSARQLESLREMVAWLSAGYGIPASEIKGHNDYASTACPGARLKGELIRIRREVGEI
jgi:hypothetical protein